MASKLTAPMSRSLNPIGSIFGGFLDVANGSRLTKKQERQLRFHCLFSESIPVPDTFFHCYGPIFLRAEYFVKRRIDPTDIRVSSDIMMRAIGCGAVAPALRSRASTLEENFLSDRVQRGSFLIPDERRGRPVLRFLDRLLQGRQASGQWAQHLSKRSFHALKHRFCGAPEHVTRDRIGGALRLHKRRDGAWASLLTAFSESVLAQADKPYFMRGPLERVLAGAIDAKDADVYVQLAALKGPLLNDRLRLARYLYRKMILYYQVGQGTALADRAAVTSALDGHEADDTALKDAIGVERTDHDGRWFAHSECVNVQFLDELPADAIADLQNGPLLEYRERLSRLSTSATGNALNRLYVEESAEYRRKIVASTKSPVLDATLRLLLPLAAHGAALSGPSDRLFSELAWFVTFASGPALERGKQVRDQARAKRLGRAFNNFLSSGSSPC